MTGLLAPVALRSCGPAVTGKQATMPARSAGRYVIRS
jgi:hypothetical protein